MTETRVQPLHLFVYGTLRPGEVRWQHLAPFVVDDGVDTSVPGELFDTGLEYPAAVFAHPTAGGRTIVGRVYQLGEHSLTAALAHLDEVEGAVRGLYHRVVVATSCGREAWAYQCGEASLLRRRIPSGDWLRR